MNTTCTRWVTVCAFFALAATSSAQLGRTYENTQHGFSYKPIKDWKAVPPKPGETQLVVRHICDQAQTARKIPFRFNPENEILTFRKASVTGGTAPLLRGVDSFEKYFELRYSEAEHVKKPKKRTINKAPCVEYNFTSAIRTSGGDVEVRMKCFAFTGPGGLEIVLTYSSLEEQADKAIKEYDRSAKSFKFIEVDKAKNAKKTADAAGAAGFLQKQIQSLPPGWDWAWSDKKTQRYLILYNAEDKEIRQLGSHLEAMRNYYEGVFPPDEPLTAVSIVRLCADRETYDGYGAPAGSGGYWSSYHKELVVYIDKRRDRKSVFSVISHEAFHQYIYYFYGELAPHSWYNEGHGDYFGGAQMSRNGNKVQSIKELNLSSYPRLNMIKERVRRGDWVPLKDFMNYSKGQYYGPNMGYNYAQGWSVVWFLRQGKKEGVRMKPEWLQINDSYLTNLVTARDELVAKLKEQGKPPEMSRIMGREAQELAYEKTFGQWTDEQWAELEEAWKGYYGG